MGLRLRLKMLMVDEGVPNKLGEREREREIHLFAVPTKRHKSNPQHQVTRNHKSSHTKPKIKSHEILRLHDAAISKWHDFDASSKVNSNFNLKPSSLVEMDVERQHLSGLC